MCMLPLWERKSLNIGPPHRKDEIAPHACWCGQINDMSNDISGIYTFGSLYF